jgi:acyl-CoA thioester hydrolase
MEGNNVFTWEDEVRDNEVDLQGIVNNSNYFVYMAHARHKHLKSLGIDFEKMYQDGYNLVLISTEINFKNSLKSGDWFIATSKIETEGRIKFVFIQEIIRKSDSKVVVSARNVGTCVDIKKNRPFFPDELRKTLGM